MAAPAAAAARAAGSGAQCIAGGFNDERCRDFKKVDHNGKLYFKGHVLAWLLYSLVAANELEHSQSPVVVCRVRLLQGKLS